MTSWWRGRNSSNSELKKSRVYLFSYFIIILIITLFLIINYWTPSTEEVTLRSTSVKTGNATNITVPIAGPNITVPIAGPPSKTVGKPTEISVPVAGADNITTKTTTTVNATAETTETKRSVLFKNGTERIIGKIKTSEPREQPLGFFDLLFLQLKSDNAEVRLVSVSVLFGLLGACISGIISVLTRRIWDSGKDVTNWRLIYFYVSRPWIGMAVAIVTYVDS